MTTSRKMDAETRKKLYGLLPFSRSNTTSYIPEIYPEDTPDEYKPVFKIRPFSKEEINHAKALLKKMGNKEELENNDELEQQVSDYAKKVIMGWTNLYDVGTGDKIVFEATEDGSVTDDLYDALPTTIKGLILAEAVKISGLLDLSRLALK